eukprot:TRINITY_DN30923_c0_g1_i1.p1 TRINITY_DN30923_c0_g1~~TRINITY_DN30923_c0_g1_i1.p1  ORF type:complete len:138 (+),score=40.94 TRINITY_DN30923_c0_g1_i1:32-445(+)
MHLSFGLMTFRYMIFLSMIFVLIACNIIFCYFFFFFQAEDGIRDLVRSRGLGDVYKRQMERTRGNPFGELSAKKVDPFMSIFITTQAWAVHRDDTLRAARVPVEALTPRSRAEREDFIRMRERRVSSQSNESADLKE